MKDRTNWIDLLKGFAIFLVIFGHNLLGMQTNAGIFITKYIYSFHMPLFFIISGALYTKHGTFKEYVIKKTKSLLIPYFSFASILYMYWLITENMFGKNQPRLTSIKGFIGIFYGNPLYMPWGGALWFLLCLFIVSCIFYIISCYSQKIIVIAMFLTAGIGFLTSNYLKAKLPWMINTAFTGVTLYGISYISKDVILTTNTKCNWLNKNIVLIILFGFGFGTCIINRRVELAGNVYGNYILFYLSSVSSCLFYALFFKKISSNTKLYHLKKYFIYFGMNTLIILAFHSHMAIFLNIIYTTVLKIDYHTVGILYKILFSLIQLVLLVPVIYIFNKYLYILLGKSSSKIKKLNTINTTT